MKQALHLIRILRNIEVDPLVTPDNFLEAVPEYYGPFLRELYDFVNPWPGSGTFRATPFDNAGYPVFRKEGGNELFLKTQKGLMLVCRVH